MSCTHVLLCVGGGLIVVIGQMMLRGWVGFLDATCSLQGGIFKHPCRFVRDSVGIGQDTKGRVGHGVGDGADAGVALVVEFAVWEGKLAEKSPNVVVRPCEDGIDAHKWRPTGGTRLEMFHVETVRVLTTGAHDEGGEGLASGKLLDASFEVEWGFKYVEFIEGCLVANKRMDCRELF